MPVETLLFCIQDDRLKVGRAQGYTYRHLEGSVPRVPGRVETRLRLFSSETFGIEYREPKGGEGAAGASR